jgi:predicted MFS family arabinose efflux permease
MQLTIPGFGLLVPWRSAFFLCGVIGPLIGLLLLTVQEPQRHGVREGRNELPSLRESLGYLWQRRGVMVPLYAGFCLHYVAFVGITAWTAAFLTRRYQHGLAEFSGRLGLMLLLAGGAGYLAGGFVADSKPFHGAGGKRLLLAILPLVALPSTLAGFAPSVSLALILLMALSFATPIINVAMSATVQDLVPNRMRAFSYALVSVVSALPAGAGGPLAIAYATEHVAGGSAFIGRSFLIVGVPALLTASACFLLSRRASQRELT